MDISLLHGALKEEKKFRHTQAEKAVFVDLIDDWSQATTFPIALREKLNSECPLEIKAEVTGGSGKKGVAKALITLNDGEQIETVLIPQADGRFAVCLSSQVGCPLACVFCATGMNGFTRNLRAEEIVEQFLFWARYLKKENYGRIDNAVFMGQGEPFLNYEEVMKAIKILNDPENFNFGARRISISTSGVLNGIKRLAGEKLQVNLAISLHAPSDALRSNIMPLAGKTPLKKLLEAVDNYIAKTGRRVMFEYLLIKEVNDRDEDAIMLAKLLNKPLYLTNLIPYNPTGRFQPSTPARTARFKDLLERAGLSVTARRSLGQEIDAACGQLAGKRKKR
ncbi:MAG: 23S rRNA (adenine(2503)-C(2))-methyltransferase RlmN [Candidatus Falkowbacteria bacterium]|nr:23S rRNA (adenine(2503)-C(2))-methyltransferase RlmN [Candidatus Falkowbacteria bacterium]